VNGQRQLANITVYAEEPQELNPCEVELHSSISEKPYAESGYTDDLVNEHRHYKLQTQRYSADSVRQLSSLCTNITLTINDIDPDTSDVTFYIENQATGQQLAITGTFVAGDTLLQSTC
jgi:hypothetical protein